MTDLGVRAGFVWKKDQNGWQQFNTLRPFSAYNVPITITDPGPDGVAGGGDDTGGVGVQPRPGAAHRVAAGSSSDIDGYEGTYKTLEFSTNKRFSNRWGLNASYWFTWTREFGNNYFNNRFGDGAVELLVLRQLSDQPERTDRERLHRLERQAQRHRRRRLGHHGDPGVEDPERRALRSLLQRHGSTTARKIMLVEPIGTRRQDTVSVVDFRAEKQFRFAAKARVGVFADVFNAFNSNTAPNINWRSGASFEKATTVLGPRIAKFGVKFDW